MQSFADPLHWLTLKQSAKIAFSKGESAAQTGQLAQALNDYQLCISLFRQIPSDKLKRDDVFFIIKASLRSSIAGRKLRKELDLSFPWHFEEIGRALDFFSQLSQLFPDEMILFVQTLEQLRELLVDQDATTPEEFHSQIDRQINACLIMIECLNALADYLQPENKLFLADTYIRLGVLYLNYKNQYQLAFETFNEPSMILHRLSSTAFGIQHVKILTAKSEYVKQLFMFSREKADHELIAAQAEKKRKNGSRH